MVCNCVGCNILRIGTDKARLHPLERCRECLRRHRSTCVACVGVDGGTGLNNLDYADSCYGADPS